MSRPTMRRDPIEQQIEQALGPGAFIHDRACFSFVGGLGGVAAQSDEPQKTDAVRAAGLDKAYLADWEDAVRQVRAKDRWGVGRAGDRK